MKTMPVWKQDKESEPQRIRLRRGSFRGFLGTGIARRSDCFLVFLPVIGKQEIPNRFSNLTLPLLFCRVYLRLRASAS